MMMSTTIDIIRPGSSAVEHLLGKEEVVSSILILGSALEGESDLERGTIKSEGCFRKREY